ncbi:MAG TPA: GxxExxY protein [Ignavibacteria bacterium]|nr:GxxExxY protein [Ignavibacteria bacterium]
MNMIQGEKKKVLLPLSDREEEIGRLIVNAAYKVHSSLGPGLLEKIYEICFVHELKKSGLNAVRQVDVSINYDGMIFDDCLRLDVMVEDLVVCELKAIEHVNPLWYAQVLSHLKLTDKRLGYLINFNVETIKEGIKRIIR